MTKVDWGSCQKVRTEQELDLLPTSRANVAVLEYIAVAKLMAVWILCHSSEVGLYKCVAYTEPSSSTFGRGCTVAERSESKAEPSGFLDLNTITI
jgi:hypothetical protein